MKVVVGKKNRPVFLEEIRFLLFFISSFIFTFFWEGQKERVEEVKFEYACGTWRKKTSMAAHEASYRTIFFPLLEFLQGKNGMIPVIIFFVVCCCWPPSARFCAIDVLQGFREFSPPPPHSQILFFLKSRFTLCMRCINFTDAAGENTSTYCRHPQRCCFQWIGQMLHEKENRSGQNN